MTEVGVPVFGRDGSQIRIRQMNRDDRGLWRRAFVDLEEEPRSRRFHASRPSVSTRMVHSLTALDRHHPDAVVALDDETAQGIGVARYVRDPSRPGAAEVALAVLDGWQGRGVGTLLLGALCEQARRDGIVIFTATVLATSAEVMDAFDQLGPLRVVASERGAVTIEIPNPAAAPVELIRRLA